MKVYSVVLNKYDGDKKVGEVTGSLEAHSADDLVKKIDAVADEDGYMYSVKEIIIR